MKKNNTFRRAAALMAALSITVSLAAPAFADTYYIDYGDITITKNEDGSQTIQQGGDKWTDKAGEETVITTSNTVITTLESDLEGPAAEDSDFGPVVEDNYQPAQPEDAEKPEGADQPESAEEPKSADRQESADQQAAPAAAPADTTPVNPKDDGFWGNTITVINNIADKVLNLTLKDVKIDVSDTGDQYDWDQKGKAALSVQGDGNVEIELDGKNELKSGANHAGVEKNNSDSKGTLTIKDDTGEKGSLTATGGAQGAGIGGAKNNSGSNIEITGGTITATGGCNNNEAGNGGAAGIGGGFNGSGTDIKITGGNVTANGSRKPDGTSGCQGAGIGGGYGKGGTNISISGEDTVVNANGGKYGAGIGGGAMGAGENITISDGAHVTANGGAQGAGIGGGSGIGGNGSNITISGDKTYVEATGGGDAEAAGAGIGGGFSGRYGNVGKGSDITIEGGTVIATGGSVTSDSGGGAAGIGGGSGYAPRDDKAGNGEHIYIKGDANVTAKGGNGAAGIGGGNTNNKMGDAIDIVIEGNAKVTTEAGGDVSIGGKNGEISNDDLLSKDFTGILTRKDNTGKVMEDYSKDATPLPASEENGVVWVDADVSGWGGVRIAVPEGTPTDSVSACYLEEGALLIVDAGGSDCLLEGRVSDLRQNGIRQLCLRWNGGEQTLSTDALAAAGGEDASFRLTEVNGGLTMVLNGLTRNELLAK